jgi:decaprenyl-phosphate phosphoribosyltransferase
VAAALVRAARPQQWSKNFLVFVPALMVADQASGRRLVDLGVTAAAYCLAASGIYLVNDVQDASLDRSHPAKRLRPVASGTVSAKVAAVAGAALMVAGLAVTTTLGSVRLVGVPTSPWPCRTASS